MTDQIIKQKIVALSLFVGSLAFALALFTWATAISAGVVVEPAPMSVIMATSLLFAAVVTAPIVSLRWMTLITK